MIRVSVAVECDSCGTRTYERVPARRTASRVGEQLRRRLEGQGWAVGRVPEVRGATDYCPRCQS